MSGYTKLFGSILQSTVWELSTATKVVWITMLALSDGDGVVSASVPGLAKAAGVERGECERALALFLAPDLDSRTKLHEGRRIAECEGGWRLLNHDYYQHLLTEDDRKRRNAEKQARWRERNRNRDNNRSLPDVTGVTENNQGDTLRQASASASASAAAADSDAGANQQPPISVHAGRLTTYGISTEWHAAVRLPGAGDPMTLHAEANWRPDYETILCVLTQLPEHHHWPAARAVCRWFWSAPDGPIQSGRIKRGNATPAHLAKRISSDLRAANDWWFAQSDAIGATL